MAKIVFFDTETGGIGINAARDWSLIQLGAVVYDTEDPGGGPRFECVINEELVGWELLLHPDALKINGFTEERIRTEGVSPMVAAVNFLRFCWTHIPKSLATAEPLAKPDLITLGAHNVGYDTHFLYRLFRAAGCPELYDTTFNYRTIDTATIARFLIDTGLVPLQKPSSETLFEFFDCKPSRAHDALEDAIAAAQLYKKMSLLITNNIRQNTSLDDIFVCRMPGPSVFDDVLGRPFPELRKRY
jgi:DNA polymerase III epsilon subunit-like protein